jgi:pyruvate,orthophosphate dikinase
VALDGSCELGRDRLGGKAWGINRMRALDLPGPPAFAITADVCATFRERGADLPDEVWQAARAALADLEAATGHRFGDPSSPLLVSVRSGAAQSMPGMMDTVLNLGLNRELRDGLARETGDVRWAQDTWKRFCQSYAEIVGLAEGATEPPAEPWEQLHAAICAVFRSWGSPRAQAYRHRNGISEAGGTAVTVQAMVFGNRDAFSGTGVLFSRDPSTGEPSLYGEWMTGGQGEDVVSGDVTPAGLAEFAEALPEVYDRLVTCARALEAEFADMVDIEFTVESGRFYILQVRSGKRSAQAALRIAVQLAEAGVIDRGTALSRITPEHARTRYGTRRAAAGGEALASGAPASPGLAAGTVVTDPDEALDADPDTALVLVRGSTSPDDVPAMYGSVAVVTEKGGQTSHAALVCREAGLPCVVGCGEGVVEKLAGRIVTVDGGAGAVWDGDQTAVAGRSEPQDWESTLLAWVREKAGVAEPRSLGDLAELLEQLGAQKP